MFLVTSLGLGSVLLSLSYVTGITLLSRTPGGSRAIAPLATVGRMALFNYVMHSIVMSTLAYGYGAGRGCTNVSICGSAFSRPCSCTFSRFR